LARRTHALTGLLAATALAACATPPGGLSPADAPDSGATRDNAGTTAAPPATDADPAGASASPMAGHPAVAPLSRTPPLEPAAPETLGSHPDQSTALDHAPPADADDLIAGLRAGFSLPRLERPEVMQHVAWFERHPAYFERVLERARPYLPHVAREVEARGLPAELAFLPMIESAFDPFAYSHGRAAGLWQIVPATGRHLGLKQNWWYDGRRDVLASTRVALDYLEYLHGLFDGDWLLAVAAYNSGQGRVGRAIRKNRAAGRPTDFWHLRLPRETRSYVPRLLALARVLDDPAAHGLSLPRIPREAAFADVELDGQIDLAVAAELAGIELAELQRLNPGFNRWATDPDGPHRLLLPADSVTAFRAALAKLPPEARVRWQRHQVRRGETLGGIAQRYKTTIGTLQSVNGLSGTRIRAGAHLMIPTATRSAAAYPLSAENRLASTQSRDREGRARSDYTVRSGDSLWTIARRHDVGVRELAAWNGMAPGDTLSIGRTLVVWVPEGGGARAGRASVTTAPGGLEPTLRRINYTVRRGDSLHRIADNFRVSVADIRRWNDLHGQRYLQPGQRLVLHVDVTAQSGG